MKNRIFGSAVALIAAANLLVAGGIASATSTDYVPELVYTITPDQVDNDSGFAIDNMASFGEKLAFTTDAGDFYVTDGTEAGTHSMGAALDDAGVSEVRIDREGQQDQYLSLDYNGQLLFWGYVGGSWELFLTDGTLVNQITDGLNGFGTLYNLDGAIYSANSEGSDRFVQIDVEGETFDVVQDAYDCGIYDGKDSAVAVNGKIIFEYDDNNCDEQLVVWDPSTPNVDPVFLTASINGLGRNDTDVSYIDYNEHIEFYVFEGKAYFAAFGNDNNGDLGWELFATDGTQGGTALVKDIASGSDYSYPGSSWQMTFTEFNGELYFYAYDGTDDLLYKTDGTENGTVEVPMGDLTDPGDNSEGQGIVLNGRMITTFDGGYGDDWASTDGTEAGTEFLINDGTDSDSNACWDDCPVPVLFDDHAFFMGYDNVDDVNAIWVTDGTAAGTEQVTDADFAVSEYAISDYAEDAPLVVAGDNLYFALSDWDGTGASALYKLSAQGDLAETGVDAGASLWAGFGLLVAGVAVVTVRRRLVK